MSDLPKSSRTAAVADLSPVVAVSALLVAVHLFVPVAVQDRLAFDHGAFEPATLLTAAYVHAGREHLLNNVGGFVSLTVVTYLVCCHADRRDWFRRTVPAFLVVLPVAVNLTSYALLETRYPGSTPVSRGFSGVVAGFGGFLLAATTVQLRTVYSRATAFFVGQFAILLLLGELLWIYADRIAPLEGIALVSGLLLSVSGIAARGRARTLSGDHYRRVGIDLTFVALVLTLLAWLVYGLFPADPLAEGVFTNVFAHGAGFVEGGLLAALTFVWFDPPTRGHARDGR